MHKKILISLYTLLAMVNFTTVASEKSLQRRITQQQEEAFLQAAEDGNLEVVRASLATGVNINARSQDRIKETALAKAVTNGHLAVVKTLLASNADVNQTDCLGQTPLVAAVFFSKPLAIVQELCDHTTTTIPENTLGAIFSIAGFSSNEALIRILVKCAYRTNPLHRITLTPEETVRFPGLLILERVQESVLNKLEMTRVAAQEALNSYPILKQKEWPTALSLIVGHYIYTSPEEIAALPK